MDGEEARLQRTAAWYACPKRPQMVSGGGAEALPALGIRSA